MHIYNTFTQKKERFKPLVPGKVGIYVCGVTVYDYCHIGHARTYLAFDIVVRYLRYAGFDVNYVRNITDIDDKIIQRAKENKESIESLSQRFTEAMHQDFEALGLERPTQEPKATETVAGMIQMIQTLIEKEHAYVAQNGDVYYAIQAFSSYGALAHRDRDQLKAGARIEANEAKQCPLDFVLWKSAKPGEPAWESPWGLGRPGWHTECSAMSLEHLGPTVDIHGGGADLMFPHHENERAQSMVANEKPFVNYWMHVGYLQEHKQKMSKSLGNFVTIRDFLARYDAEVLRLFVISSHYRSPIEYSLAQIDLSIRALERLYHALRGFVLLDVSDAQASVTAKDPASGALRVAHYEARFQGAMEDDFNTPEALAVLFDLAREINRLRSEQPEQAAQGAALLRKLGNVLGLLSKDPQIFLQRQTIEGTHLDKEAIEALIQARNQGRAAKNWMEADRIRDLLLAEGIVLEDTPDGTVWQNKKG
jgi:cysteinyl-tRNA synthetase